METRKPLSQMKKLIAAIAPVAAVILAGQGARADTSGQPYASFWFAGSVPSGAVCGAYWETTDH